MEKAQFPQTLLVFLDKTATHLTVAQKVRVKLTAVFIKEAMSLNTGSLCLNTFSIHTQKL